MPVRVRFAPSPTGALHIGGVRTALFNYLFAKKHQGDFILRIEDTDQLRFTQEAEKYIVDSLQWLAIIPDESPQKGGEYGPYRQSERMGIYQKYAQKMLEEGKAYYAFDTPEQLEAMRQRLQKLRVLNPQYDMVTRTTMKNSFTLSAQEVNTRIQSGEPYVIRIKIPEKKKIRVHDMVRGWIVVKSEVLDDKVLIKSDGMPTYHLANVVDDHLMHITHVIRGEEWLPSVPLHILLYQYLGWGEEMPKMGHLPLILKPDGKGKLSKRAANKAGFPIFPLKWKVSMSEQMSPGFKEMGFNPKALINFLAFQGWNPGTDQEIFDMEELIQHFSMERVNKAGIKFDFEKAKWFNQQYIKKMDSTRLAKTLSEELKNVYQITCTLEKAKLIIDLLKDRVTFPNDFIIKSLPLFQNPTTYDDKVIQKKWNKDAQKALELFSEAFLISKLNSPEEIKQLFYDTLQRAGLKMNQYMQILRLSVFGLASGPDLMKMIFILGNKVTSMRINNAIIKWKQQYLKNK